MGCRGENMRAPDCVSGKQGTHLRITEFKEQVGVCQVRRVKDWREKVAGQKEGQVHF